MYLLLIEIKPILIKLRKIEQMIFKEEKQKTIWIDNNVNSQYSMLDCSSKMLQQHPYTIRVDMVEDIAQDLEADLNCCRADICLHF